MADQHRCGSGGFGYYCTVLGFAIQNAKTRPTNLMQPDEDAGQSAGIRHGELQPTSSSTTAADTKTRELSVAILDGGLQFEMAEVGVSANWNAICLGNLARAARLSRGRHGSPCQIPLGTAARANPRERTRRSHAFEPVPRCRLQLAGLQEI